MFHKIEMDTREIRVSSDLLLDIKEKVNSPDLSPTHTSGNKMMIVTPP